VNAVSPAKSGLRELIEQLLVAVVLALFARTFVLQTFKIPTGSMEDSLLVGDQLIVNKMVFSDPAAMWRGVLPVDSITRGDVLVFKYPVDPERDFIKRVIALPGETIEVRNKRVYVDGTALDEPYARFLFPRDPEGAPKRSDPRWNFGPYTVGPGHYFMMGDNRDNSLDAIRLRELRRDPPLVAARIGHPTPAVGIALALLRSLDAGTARRQGALVGGIDVRHVEM
jgi:signal peptidase I